MNTTQPGGGGRHDEPNEFGFAGDPSLPGPQRPHGPQEREEEEVEAVAVPADDLTEGLTESIEDDQLEKFEREQEPPAGR